MNNENKNEGLNTISLGSITNTDNLNVPVSDIPPIAPPEPVEMLENPKVASEVQINTEAVGTKNVGIINEVSPLEPVPTLNYDIPQAFDFNTTPVFNEIGTVPPITNGPIVEPVINDEPKKKKNKVNKLIFVMIIVLALAAVGVIVYILLHVANKPKVHVKMINLEIGSLVSSNINDYATFSKIDSSLCSLDTTGITDTNVYGAEYIYKITCDNTTYTGKVKIVDTIKPEIKLKDVNVSVNSDVKAEDFILSCTDKTKCSYSFKDETKVKEYLKTPESYHVTIIVKDEAGNEVEVVGTLVVSNTVASLYLICNKETDKYLESTKLGLVESTFNKVATRTYTFKFDSENNYNTFKSANLDKTEITYLNITGQPTFIDEELKLTLNRIMSYELLNTEAGATVPLPYSELKAFYQNKGYKCNIGY